MSCALHVNSLDVSSQPRTTNRTVRKLYALIVALRAGPQPCTSPVEVDSLTLRSWMIECIRLGSSNRDHS